MDPARRGLFDDLLDRIIQQLPEALRALLEEVPLIVEDEPSPRLLADLGMALGGVNLCGLHSGISLTQRSVETLARLPDRMMLFRGPIMRVVGFASVAPGRRRQPDLRRQIRITLLHEIGHHFGLDEDDLAKLGYG